MSDKSKEKVDSESKSIVDKWISDAEKDPSLPLPSGAFIATMNDIKKMFETQEKKFAKIDKHLKNLYGKKSDSVSGRKKKKVSILNEDFVKMVSKVFSGDSGDSGLGAEAKASYKRWLNLRNQELGLKLVRERIKNVGLMEDLGLDPKTLKKWGLEEFAGEVK